MNFIAEFSEENKSITDEFLDLRITRLALDWSNLLLELNEDTFNKIAKIVLVNKSKVKDEEIEKVFKKFTVIFEQFYKHNETTAKLLLSYFPEKNTNQSTLITRIDNLIRNTEVLKSKLVRKDEEYIAYFDTARELIEYSEIRIDKIIIKGKSSRIKTSDDYEVVEANKYYDFVIRLNSLPTELENYIEAHYYKHKPFFDHFDRAFVIELEKLIKENDSRAFIYGEDNFIAVKSKDYVFNGEDDYFDLRRGIPFIEKKTKSIAFNFVHQLSPTKFNDLRKNLMPLLEGRRILFLGEEFDLDNSLGIFCDNIPIPNSENVKLVITKLFIALLLEERVLNGKMSAIYEVINNNGFRIFLDEIETLNELYKAIKQIDEITTEDLISNVFFWIKFTEVLESQRNKNKVKVHEHENTLSMIFENGEWIMIFNDDELIRSNKAFMIYLDVIIQYQKRFNENIDVVTLRKAVIKYQRDIIGITPKGNTEELEEEACRKAAGKAIKDFQTDSEQREKFIENFINYNKYSYTFNARKIKLQEIISPIDDNFFDDLD